MIKEKKVLVMLLMLFLFMPLMSAAHRQNADLLIEHSVRVEDRPEPTTICNITFRNPDKAALITSEYLTFNASTQQHEYLIESNNFTNPGTYTYDITCNFQSAWKTESFETEITPSGQSGNANIVFFIFLILMLYGINLVGYFGRNAPMTLLGGMALMFLGVYLINQGVIIYRDNLTNYFSYVTLAWGFVSAFLAGFSLYEEM